MWSKAPRWVRWVIGLISGLFATTLGLLLAILVAGALVFQGCEFEFSFGEPDPNPALTAAIRRCDVDAVEAEIDKGGRPFVDGRFTLYDDGPSLTEALECGSKMADVLVAYAVENGGGDSVLHAAVATDDVELVARVLDAGVDIDARDDAGDTALLDAVTDDDGAMLNLLLDQGADPDLANDSGHTPLFRAVGLDRPLAAARLLAAGADPNRPARLTIYEIMAAASLRGAGSDDVDAATYDVLHTLQPALGYVPGEAPEALEPVTLLYLAVAMSSDEVVGALLDAGADPTIGNGPTGHRPAAAAELLGRTELAARIRAAGG